MIQVNESFCKKFVLNLSIDHPLGNLFVRTLLQNSKNFFKKFLGQIIFLIIVEHI